MKRKHERGERSVIAVDTSGGVCVDEAYPVTGSLPPPDAEFESAMKRPKSIDSNLSSAAEGALSIDRPLSLCNRDV